jgi:hypothetical protein
MRTTLSLILTAVVLAGLARVARADDAPAKEDRAVYHQLIDEIRDAHVRLARAYRRAVDEARDNNGTSEQRTRAEIITLREEIDRKNVRLMLVADRHGWEVPRFSLEDVSEEQLAEETPDDGAIGEIFPQDPMIIDALAAEAREVAAKLALPIVQVASTSEKDDDDGR